MKRFQRSPARSPGEVFESGRTRHWLIAAVGLAVAWTALPSGAGTPENVVRVEEDWVLEIGVPDPQGNAPQILTAMSSTNMLADVHAVFELNHRTKPDYTPGGMQLQIWSGDTILDHRPGPKHGVLSNENETITYTMRMQLNGSNVEFEVRNGNSTTWGTFGGQGYLKSSMHTDQNNLSLYSPDVSAASSAVTFAKHRVRKFALKEVRYYSNQGLVATDTEERIVHQHTGE